MNLSAEERQKKLLQILKRLDEINNLLMTLPHIHQDNRKRLEDEADSLFMSRKIYDPDYIKYFSGKKITDINKNTDLKILLKELKEQKHNLNYISSYFNNNKILSCIYNGFITMALFIIKNRKELDVDINSCYENQRTPLQTAIYKGFQRCDENNCNAQQEQINLILNNTIFFGINKIQNLNFGELIKKLLDCEEIDIDKTYFDEVYGQHFTATELALLVYDFDTLNIIYNKKGVLKVSHDFIITDNYGDKFDITKTYAWYHNEYRIKTRGDKSIDDVTYFPELLKNDGEIMKVNKQKILPLLNKNGGIKKYKLIPNKQ